MKRLLQNNTFIGIILALFVFVIYLQTLAPTVDFIDSGELAAVATTLGIAHPTGYPLFTLIGWVFAHLPLGLRTIYQLNLMSAFLCSLAVFFYYRLFLLLLLDDVRTAFGTSEAGSRDKQRTPPGGSSVGRKGLTPANGYLKRGSYGEKQLAAAVGSLVLAFSETHWSLALSIEVYSLHIFFLPLILLFFMRALLEHTRGPEPSDNLVWWYAFAFTLGLSFTNHMTTILLAPGFLYLYFKTHGSSRSAWLKIGKAVFPFLLGFSVYLYLPLRAAREPLLNWGNPATLEKFWWHFTGKQYRSWFFSSFESAARQLGYFLESYPGEFAYLPLVLALAGLVLLFRKSRTVFVFTLLLFLSCVLYSINYDIHDIDSYFLLAYCTTAIWITFGVLSVARKIGNPFSRGALGVVLVGTLVYVHYRSVDESRNFVVEDYTRNMFASLRPDALVLSYQWDYFVSASYYYQLVEGIRPDVVVLDKELFRRSWYFDQLDLRYPWLIERSRAEVNAFLSELHKFEHGLPYHPAVIQARFEAMIVSFLEKNYDSRPLYVTHEIEQEFTRGFQRIPEGLAFRLTRDTTVQRLRPVEFTIRDFPRSDKYTETVRSLYASSYTNQALLATYANDRQTALDILVKALAMKPGHTMARELLQRLQRQ